MNQEIKKRWCEALTSGEYKQCTEALHMADGSFCCLGVLTDLFIKESNHEWIPGGGLAGEVFRFKDDGGYLADEVIEWSGIDRDSMFALSAMNDGGRDFSEIAEYIQTRIDQPEKER